MIDPSGWTSSTSTAPSGPVPTVAKLPSNGASAGRRQNAVRPAGGPRGDAGVEARGNVADGVQQRDAVSHRAGVSGHAESTGNERRSVGIGDDGRHAGRGKWGGWSRAQTHKRSGPRSIKRP